ncbi:MAG TPA: integration host factor subunit beta [Spirochaetes bacterium]|nr:integration host factor subunit beta [Spirochaetota bacterium]
MTKAEIVEEISEKLGLTKKDIARVVDLFFEIIKEGLKREEHIELRGFGTFEVKTREEREARNPKTGETVTVPKRKVPYFRPGKELKAISKIKVV